MAANQNCPICQERFGFFSRGFWSINAPRLADAAICETCHRQLCKLLRFKKLWIPEDQVRKNPWRLMSWQKTGEIALDEARALFALRDTVCKKACEALGQDAENVLVSAESFRLSPSPAVAIHRVRKLSLKMAVGGLVLQGGFHKGDTVTLLYQGARLQREIIEVVPDDQGNFKSADFYDRLSSNVHKQELNAGDAGWLILDLEGLSPEGGLFLLGN